MGSVVTTPATYTATCDVPNCTTAAATSQTPVPSGWEKVAKGRIGQSALLCPTHLTAYNAFWAGTPA